MCNESPPALGDHLFLWLLIAIYRIYKKNKSDVWNVYNHPRRPWDRYTAPNSKCIGAEHPPPPQKKKQEKKNNEMKNSSF